MPELVRVGDVVDENYDIIGEEISMNCEVIELPTGDFYTGGSISIYYNLTIFIYSEKAWSFTKGPVGKYHAHPLEIARAFHCSFAYNDTGVIIMRDNHGKSIEWQNNVLGALKC